MKKITIVTPAYNSERFIEKTLKSVLDQDYPNLEYIVVDGGSTDGTLQIVEKYSDRIHKIISEPDEGVYHAIKKGFSHATGEIFGWINSDDMLMPGSLMTINLAFSQIKNCNWITGVPLNMSEGGTIYPASLDHFKRSYTFLEYINSKPYSIQQESTFFRKSLYHEASGLSLKYKLAGDYELWAKFLKIHPVTILGSYLGAFRKHPTQLSKNKGAYLNEVNEIRDNFRSKELRSSEYIRKLSKVLKVALPRFLSTRIFKNCIYLFDEKSQSFKKDFKWR